MQAEDGSFTNVLGTVHALPALIGALPYDVADLPCPKGDKGQAEVFAIIVIKPYFIQYGFNILETCTEHSSSGSGNTHHTHTRTHTHTHSLTHSLTHARGLVVIGSKTSNLAVVIF